MASTYKHKYGFDWPVGMSDEFIGLVIGKKWREYKAQGVEFKDPWIPYMDALIALFGSKFKRSPWAEQHVHDWVMEDYIVTWGAASSGKALLPSEPVYCADGPRPIGDIVPGDYVYASTGNLVRVRGVYRQYGRPLYRVTFADLASIVCASEHLWTYRTRDGVMHTTTVERLAEVVGLSLPCECEIPPATLPKLSYLGGGSSYSRAWRPILTVAPVTHRASYPSETVCITIDKVDVRGRLTHGLFVAGEDFIVTHNSNDTGALAVTDWVVDPYDTTTLIGSTTKDALRIRTWESVERYFALLKSSARFYVPGKITQTGYSILNDRDNDDDPLAQGAKAGIHGVALNDGGKLQGAHSKYVRLIIDELATINNHDGKGGILETIDNLQITTDFKFSALANPEGWLDQSSQYCIPEGGVESVNVDTGSWRSTFGCFVRHHDGMKSICVKDPTKVKEFPYLTQQKHVDQALKRSNGNMDSPRFWKMIRGFPVPSGASGPVVLDPQVAVANGVSEPPPNDVPFRVADVAAGVDPAWTEGGDGACYVRVRVLVDDVGRPLLDFTGGLRYLQINGSDRRPAVEQMRCQIIDIMSDRTSPQAMFRSTAVDSSGNQGLADELQIHAGANCLKVNSSEAASDLPLRAGSSDPASKSVKDRGTESWTVLAEFCRARMVRGLPPEAVRALTTRRLATKPSGEALLKDTLEPKREFKLRFKHSPDECDACALAALAVKERLGVLPYGSVPRPPTPEYLVRSAPPPQAAAAPRTEDDYASDVSSDDFCGPSI